MQTWRADVERAKKTTTQGHRLIYKTLVVTGKRQFVKRKRLPRLAAALIKVCSLGIVRLPDWRLTSPEPVREVPVILEHAFGGQCRIEQGDKVADRVPKKHRLTPEQAETHPDAPHAPVAHDAYSANVVGQGFTRDWYLDAAGVDTITAPQIEYPEHPVTVDHFNRARVGELDVAQPLVAGLGVRPKGHPDRAKLVGTIDRAFIESDAPLPKDFDFAVWNAAWPDQQVDALRGDEQIELVNLCNSSTPRSRQDASGDVRLTLRLPGHLPFVLVRFENGSIGELESRLDTVLIDPDRREVSCVWRATVAKEPDVRVLEMRMIERHDTGTTMPEPLASQDEGVVHG